jgi:hypothetical protein
MNRRGLTKAEAAAYCGCHISTFDRWRKAGRVPGPIAGTSIYDKAAIDLALDRASGLIFSDAVNSIEEWRRTHGNQDQT